METTEVEQEDEKVLGERSGEQSLFWGELTPSTNVVGTGAVFTARASWAEMGDAVWTGLLPMREEHGELCLPG